MNKRKYSILNLVNCILLALTLTFSVISYAWYSPAEEIASPLSFSAGDTSSTMDITKLMVDDENNLTVVETEWVGDENFIATSLNFGTIDDLGVLKQSNIVYYCLKIPVSSGTDTFINLSYTDSHFASGASARPGFHFNIHDENGNILGENLHQEVDAAGREDFETGKTYLAYSCVVSDTAPESISATALIELFDPTSGTPAPKYPFSAPDYSPQTDATPELREVSTEATEGYYYVYIKIHPDLDNYHEIAQVLMDYMPFFITFGIKLYVDTKPLYQAEN